MAGMGNGVADAAAMGLAMAVIAPLLALYFSGRVAKIVRVLARHPALVLTAFVFEHAALIAAMTGYWSPAWLTGLLRISLVVIAVAFWLPVVDRNGLGDAARIVYLFIAGPLLDLPALYLIASGRSAAGIAMIVTMLPIPLAAVTAVYSWMRREERDAIELQRLRESPS
ncbi:hypothetical protein [Actinocrinis sp.]|uniref:hypothetical protein n=1 Tax=Actinocrinis sp. TaxID=1920516 RepID=UPI002D401591|nr:hypothetical protein [Actinocrinis sp.]HZP49976.1 hypothetical protein [Actinocrinis sp.]